MPDMSAAPQAKSGLDWSGKVIRGAAIVTGVVLAAVVGYMAFSAGANWLLAPTVYSDYGIISTVPSKLSAFLSYIGVDTAVAAIGNFFTSTIPGWFGAGTTAVANAVGYDAAAGLSSSTIGSIAKSVGFAGAAATGVAALNVASHASHHAEHAAHHAAEWTKRVTGNNTQPQRATMGAHTGAVNAERAAAIQNGQTAKL